MKKLTGLLLVCFFISSVAQSFTLNSSTNPNLTGWDGGDVKLNVNTANCPAGADVEGLINDSVAVWNNVPGSKVKVSYGSSTTSTTFSSPPTVYCEVNFQTVTGADQNGVPGAAAVQTSSDGQINKGLMYLNVSAGNANISNFNRTVLTIILAHEIGHLLGLGHSQSTNALMYYDATLKTQLSLSQDDMDGMAYLYPSDELKDGKLLGCGTVFHQTPPPSSGRFSLMMALLLLPLIACLGLRRRARRISV